VREQHICCVLFSKVVTRFIHLVHALCPHVLNPAVAHAAPTDSERHPAALWLAPILTDGDDAGDRGYEHPLTPCRRAQLVDERLEWENGQLADAATAVFVFRVVHHQFLRWSIHPHHHLLSR